MLSDLEMLEQLFARRENAGTGRSADSLQTHRRRIRRGEEVPGEQQAALPPAVHYGR